MNGKYIKAITIAIALVVGYTFFSSVDVLHHDTKDTNISVSHTPKNVKNVLGDGQHAHLSKTIVQPDKHLEEIEDKSRVDDKKHDVIDERLSEDSHAYYEASAKSLVNSNGVIQQNNIVKALNINDFNSYIENLNILATEADSLKKYEIEDFIASLPTMQSYQHAVSCGFETCAMSIQNVPSDKAAHFVNNLLEDIPLGARFYRTVDNDYGSSELRIIYQKENTDALIMNVL